MKRGAGAWGARDLLVGWEEPEELIRHVELANQQVESERYDVQRAREMYEDLNSEREALRESQLGIEAQELRRARTAAQEEALSALKAGFAHLTGPMRPLFIQFQQQLAEHLQKEQHQVLPPHSPCHALFRPLSPPGSFKEGAPVLLPKRFGYALKCPTRCQGHLWALVPRGIVESGAAGSVRSGLLVF